MWAPLTLARIIFVLLVLLGTSPTKRAVKWEVQCYTLPDIFENYWGIQKPYKDVFIKIDVETYECKLVPSFYDWLKGEKYLPTMYISFHPQIQKCTEEECKTVLMFIGLYDNGVLSGKLAQNQITRVMNLSRQTFKRLIQL